MYISNITLVNTDYKPVTAIYTYNPVILTNKKFKKYNTIR